MLNLHTGLISRLSYGVWMLEQMVEKYSKSNESCDLYFMYDIACTLHKHLKVCISFYRSPCFKFTNAAGNSCLHAYPNKAVSSSALYLLELRNIFPARKSLQRDSCNSLNLHHINKLNIHSSVP